MLGASPHKERFMHAIDLIKTEHRAIRRLFAQFDKLDGGDQQGQESVVKELVALLHKHAAAEEDVFYPQVAKADAEPTEQMQDSADEHEHIDQMVDELSSMSASAPDYRQRFLALRNTMMEHMREEEREVLPAAEASMDADTLEALGKSMRKEQRSHGHTMN
jgi:hemerythrin superfamily protein